jgi:nucleoid-associated protein YgaU
MIFQAKLLKTGQLFRRWRMESRVGGTISDVYFRWDGKDYVVDAVPADALNAILNNPMIVVSLVTTPVGELKPSEEAKPVEELKPNVSSSRVTVAPVKKIERYQTRQ